MIKFTLSVITWWGEEFSDSEAKVIKAGVPFLHDEMNSEKMFSHRSSHDQRFITATTSTKILSRNEPAKLGKFARSSSFSTSASSTLTSAGTRETKKEYDTLFTQRKAGQDLHATTSQDEDRGRASLKDE
ncbi:unnamed protein product [Amoebophrya sp. A120]|nr:unnamed protein product [Amoebophrya sp. A120]|eukprot:GSA120T00012642001.1